MLLKVCEMHSRIWLPGDDRFWVNMWSASKPATKAPQPSTQGFRTKGNYSKNVKKKEKNSNKKEVIQAHAIQVQTLQNELE